LFQGVPEITVAPAPPPSPTKSPKKQNSTLIASVALAPPASAAAAVQISSTGSDTLDTNSSSKGISNFFQPKVATDTPSTANNSTENSNIAGTEVIRLD